MYYFARGKRFTLMLRSGARCWYRMSQQSRHPSIRVVKKTEGRVGLQHPSVRFSVYELVHMMEDSLMSSDQILAHQSPTVRKFLGKQGFLCKA